LEKIVDEGIFDDVSVDSGDGSSVVFFILLDGFIVACFVTNVV